MRSTARTYSRTNKLCLDSVLGEVPWGFLWLSYYQGYAVLWMHMVYTSVGTFPRGAVARRTKAKPPDATVAWLAKVRRFEIGTYVLQTTRKMIFNTQLRLDSESYWIKACCSMASHVMSPWRPWAYVECLRSVMWKNHVAGVAWSEDLDKDRVGAPHKIAWRVVLVEAEYSLAWSHGNHIKAILDLCRNRVLTEKS